MEGKKITAELREAAMHLETAERLAQEHRGRAQETLGDVRREKRKSER